MDAHRFPVRFILVVCATFVGAALFNVLIDPYGFFRLVSIRGLNARKFEQNAYIAQSKIYSIFRLRPASLILGDSRADRGFDPAHQGWKPVDTAVFNFGTSGASICDMASALKLALRYHKLEQVIVALNIEQFDGSNECHRSKSAPGKYGAGVGGLFQSDPDDLRDFYKFTYLKDIFLSWGTVMSSFTTIKLQNKDPENEPDLMLFDGLPSGRTEVLWSPYNVRAAFRGNLKYYVTKAWFPNGSPLPLSHPVSHRSVFEPLKEILELADSNGFELELVISPVHASMLAAISLSGLWPTYDKWLRSITEISSSHPNAKLWDFADLNDITAEPIPEGPLARGSRWYWETCHFKKEVGDLVMSRIFGLQDPRVPENFGVRLSPKNVSAHLREMGREIPRYIARDPSLFGDQSLRRP